MVTPQDSTHRCKSWSVKYLSCYNLCRNTRINISTAAQRVVNISFIDPLDSFVVLFSWPCTTFNTIPSIWILLRTITVLGNKRWNSGESARLQPMWPRFKSWRRRHMWVEFVVDSLLCSERFSSGYSGFPLSSKTNIFKFQFDQESGRRRTTLGMCCL